MNYHQKYEIYLKRNVHNILVLPCLLLFILQLVLLLLRVLQLVLPLLPLYCCSILLSLLILLLLFMLLLPLYAVIVINVVVCLLSERVSSENITHFPLNIKSKMKKIYTDQ